MKKSLFIIATLIGSQMLIAQENDTITVNTEKVNSVWYSLENGVKGSSPIADWDLAFDLKAQDAAIRINDANGLVLYVIPNALIEDWETVDTVGIASWEKFNNSDTEWRMGALNHKKDPTYPQPLFDYGWGTYDFNGNHNVNGTRLFVIKLKNGAFKKLWIKEMESSNGGRYKFVYANIDGSDEQNVVLEKSDFPNKQFAYYSIQNNEEKDIEPAGKTEWDLYFGKYITVVHHPVYDVTMPYSAPGILSNENVTVAKVTDVEDVEAYDDWWGQEYSTDINTIGWEWEDYNWGVGGSHLFPTHEDWVFFVKSQAGNIWKLHFVEYNNSTGEFRFTQKQISTASVQDFELAKPEVIVYPNPASSHVSIILNNLTNETTDIQILSTTGEIVYSYNVEGTSNFEVKNISTEQFSAGVYFIKVTNGTQQINQKLIVQ